MAALLSFYNQENPTINLKSQSHKIVNHRPNHLDNPPQDHQENHLSIIVHIPDQHMINLDANTDNGAVDSTHFGSGGSNLKTDAHNPLPDYDNLLPAVRLDEIEEEKAGQNGSPIDNAYYDNCEANETHVAWCGAERGGPRDGDGGPVQSNDRVESVDEDNSCCGGTCCKAEFCGSVVVGTVVRDIEMGNDLFGNRSDSESGFVDENFTDQDSTNSAISNHEHGVCINSYTSSILSGEQYSNDNFPGTLSFLVNTGDKDNNCDTFSGKSVNTMDNSGTDKSGLQLNVNRMAHEEKNSDIKGLLDKDNDYDNPVTIQDRFSQTGLSCNSGKNIFSSSTFGNNSHLKSKITNMKRSVTFEDRDNTSHGTQPAVKLNHDINTSTGGYASMVTVKVQCGSQVVTPAIIITPCTPKKKLNPSANRGRSDQARKKASQHQVEESKTKEKHESEKPDMRRNKINEKKRADIGVKTRKATADVHVQKYTEICVQTCTGNITKSVQSNAESGVEEKMEVHEIPQEKQASFDAKSSKKSNEKSEGKQKEIGLTANKKHKDQCDEQQTPSSSSTNSTDIGGNIEQSSGVTCQDGTKVPPSSHNSIYLKNTLPPTSDGVCKLKELTPGHPKPESAPSSCENSKNEIDVKVDNHNGISANLTSDSRDAIQTFSTENSAVNIDREMNMKATIPSSLNSKMNLNIENPARSLSLLHPDGKIENSTREENCVICTQFPVEAKEINVFGLHDLTSKGKVSAIFKDEIVNVSTMDTEVKSVVKDTSLTEPDVDSLLESHYTTLPVCNKVMVSRERVLYDTDSIHHAIIQVDKSTHQSKITAKEDSEEDIYAIPIPKSQRIGVCSQKNIPTSESQTERSPFLEEAPPIKPPRSPNTSSAQFKSEGVDTDHNAPTNISEVTFEIGESSTAEHLHVALDDYDYTNIPKYGRYNFFSLVRRPKIMRTVISTDKKCTAINLEMMLRFRHQSLNDIPSSASSDQVLSVEDILKSCSEFEQSNAYYRSRTSSDSTQNSSWYSMSMLGALHFYPKIYKIEETEKFQTKPESPAFTSILKKSVNTGSGNRSILKTNKDKDTAVQVKKINFADEAIKSGYDGSRRENLSGRLPDSGNGVLATSFTSSEIAMIGQNDLDQVNAKPVLKPSKVAFVDQDNLNLANEKPMLKPSKVAFVDEDNLDLASKMPSLKVSQRLSDKQLDLLSETEALSSSEFVHQNRERNCDINSGNQINKGAINDYSCGNSGKPKIVCGHYRQNSDYDTLENDLIVYTPPTRSSFLPKKANSDFSGEVDFKSATKDFMIYKSDFPALSPQTFGQHSRGHTRPQLLTSSMNVKSIEIKPTLGNTQARSLGKTTSSISSAFAQKASTPPEICPELSRSLITSRSNSSSVYSSYDIQSPIMSTNSDVFESLSPISVFSNSSDDASPGVMSTLSVDVFTDSSIGDIQFPTQTSPTYYAKLEAVEALRWLKVAGFPQYAQMFVEGQFQVDMCVIEKDHDFLDRDSLKSLFRRLQTLNKHAGIPLDTIPGKKVAGDDDDDEYLCALSDRWEYNKSTRRWSRKDVTASPRYLSKMGSDPSEEPSRSCSHDSLLDHDTESQPEESPLSEHKKLHQFASQENDLRAPTSAQNPAAKGNTLRSQDTHYASISPLQNRASNDKNRFSKGLLKKMEGFKSKKSSGQSKRPNIKQISQPIVEDSEYMRAKLESLNCVDISSKSENSSNPSLLDRSFRSSATDLPARYKSLDISTNQISPRSPYSSASTRSQSDLVARSSIPPPPSGLTSRNQHLSDYRFKSNQINLQDPNSRSYTNNTDKSTSSINSWPRQRNDVKKFLIDTNLENTAQNPHLNQSGRFPLILQNGYNEIAARSTVVKKSTEKLSSNDTGLMPDLKTGPIMTFPSKNRNLTHRKSIYDNILAPEITSEEQESRMIFPGIYQLINSESETHGKRESQEFVQRNERRSFEVRKHLFFRDINLEFDQRDAALVPHNGSPMSRTSQQIHSRDKGVSFESNLSTQSPKESSQCSDAEISSIDSQTYTKADFESFPSKSRGISLTSSPLGRPKEIILDGEAELSSIDSTSSIRTGSEISPTKSRGIFHSSSADSYFKGNNIDSRSDVSFGNNKNCEDAQRTILKKEYEDLDLILEQLYQNIDELTSYMSKEQQAQSGPSQENNSFGLYGTADHDTETSLSGGEGSTTAGSSSEDQEFGLTDLSRDDSLDQISEVTRARKDSGVGHSLPRATSERQRKKIRWDSFQKSHRPANNNRDMQVNSLSIYQIVRLQKLSLLRLTGIMEKCLPISRSGWNWMMPRFLKKQKITDFSDKKVFGVPFSVMAQRTGQPLPQCVLYAMRYLRRNCSNAVGIFRKSGVKSKIQQLRDDLENDPDTIDFEGMNAYNVADMLKTYFRDLPECLLTNKMSEIFRSIYMHVPQAQRLEAIQTAIVLLPDENREVLQSVLLFLSDISSYEADHQMNASNLAVCFTPTVFQLGPLQVAPNSPKRNYKNSPAIPDPREMMEQKAAHECLLMMILECKKLFTVTPCLYQQVQGQSSGHITPVPLPDIGNSSLDVRAFGQERIQIVLKEAHDKNRGWIQILTDGDVEVYCRKPLDECPLKEWKLIVEIEAPPIEVLHRIMNERHVWDEDLLNWSVIEKLGPHSDIFQFVLNSMAPHPCRHFCVLRYWRSDLNKGACALITMSVDHADAMEVPGATATDLGSYFLMEPCGSGRSRLTHITRMDTRGRAPEWYTRIFGHFCANFLTRLRESFRQVTSGPETRV